MTAIKIAQTALLNKKTTLSARQTTVFTFEEQQ